MPTVIDSLIVTLGLDPKNFNDQQKKTSETWLKTVVEFQKGGKTVEESSKRAAETVNLITRRVLELFAVITGSQALTEFTGKIITADAALGRFASTVGETPQRLSEWENASERFGGSAEATAATLARVNKQLFDLNRNGQMLPREFSQLQAWTGMSIDPNHGVERYMSDLSAALQKLHELRPADAHIVAQALGIDPATEQLMYKMGRGIDGYLDKLKNVAPSDAAIEAATRLQTAWVTLGQQATALGNTILASIGPAIADVIDKTTKWIDKNQDWINSGISDALKKVVDYIGSIDWNDMNAGFEKFAGIAKTTAEAIASIAANLGTVAGWVTGKPPGPAPVDPNYDPDAWKKKLGDGNVTPEAPLDPSVMNDNLTKPGADPGVDPMSTNSITKPGETTVDGNPVSKSNPLPVTISDQKSDSGGFWSNLVNGIGSFFGAGSGGGPGSKVGGMVGSGAGGDAISGPQSSSRGTKGWWTPERQSQAYQTLTAGGLSDAGARGLVSRWMNVEAAGGPGTVNSIGATGMAQWLGPRKARLMAFAKARGKNWNDFDTQLQFSLSELNGPESAAGRALRNAKTDAQGATGASMFERAEGYSAWNGMDNFTGKTYRGMAGINTGAKSAALSNISATHGATTSTTSVENHIGKIDVHSQATDADGVAADINGALNRRLFSAQANYGLA